jgi:hypothetical protein
MSNNALNDICFTQPHWRLIAQGFNIERWFNDGQGVANGGIFAPQRDHLKTFDYYYRFVSSTSTKEVQLGGGWWMTSDTFNTIKHYAQSNQLEFAYAVRLFLALPYEFSRLDRIVRAQLVKPLDAYMGEGKAAKSEKDKWTPVQHLKVTQIYIPGLYIKRPISNSNEKNLYEMVWSNISFLYASTQTSV